MASNVDGTLVGRYPDEIDRLIAQKVEKGKGKKGNGKKGKGKNDNSNSEDKKAILSWTSS